MNSKNVLLLVTLYMIFGTISCKKQVFDDGIVIDLTSPIKVNYKLSDLCESVQYIPLRNNILIKHINEIQVDDSIFFCATYPEGILAFKINEDLYKIGGIGRGPGEYLTGNRLSLDVSRNFIYIDNNLGSILKYNYQGDFIKEINIKTKILPGFIDFSDNRFVLSYPIVTSKSKNPYQWIVIDTLSDILFEKFNIDYSFSKDGPSPSGELTYNYKNKVHYWNHYNDTIFKIDSDSYKAKYILDKGDFIVNPERMSNLRNFGELKNYIVLRRIIECNNFVLVIYNFQNKSRMVLFDKNKKTSLEIEQEDSQRFGIINDIDGGPNFYPFRFVNDSMLIMTLDVYDLKKWVSTDAFKNSNPKFPEKKKQLEQLANSLDENDNPVLMLVKLNE